MTPFDAYWLPGYQAMDQTVWRHIAGHGATARAPQLTAPDIEALTARLRAARRDYLCQLPAVQIADLLGAAVNRWLDPFSPYLHQACRLIPAFTGYPEPAVRKGLAGYLANFRSENLRRLLRDELGDPELLDGFRPRPAAPGWTRACGPDLALHSFAGNVPGLPAQSLVSALLVKAASLGKTAEEEPVFAPLFARSIADVDARLAGCLAVTYWPGAEAAERGSAAAVAFELADLVVAYGSEQAIAAVRARVAPEKRLITYGHKMSFGLLTRERLRAGDLDDLAERAAYDVARFDQQGCLSPHLFYVERGGDVDASQFGRALGAALVRWTAIVPRGRLTAGERQRIADLRRLQEFRIALASAEMPTNVLVSDVAASGTGYRGPQSARLAGGAPWDRSRGPVHSADCPTASKDSAAATDIRPALFGGPEDDWCVLVDPDPAFGASCLNRTVLVKPLADLAELPALLAPVRRYLQTAGVAAEPARLALAAEILAQCGLDRICPLGQMGDPPPTWHHDGRFNLLDFLRFTDLEPESGAGRWEFSHPAEGILGLARHGAVREDGHDA